MRFLGFVVLVANAARRCGSIVLAFLHRGANVVIPLCGIAFALFVFRDYLFAGTLLYGDANFLWSHSLLRAEVWQLLHIWRSSAGGQNGAVIDATQSYVLLQALFESLGIPISTVLVWPFLIAVAFIAFWAFARALGAGQGVAALAALFYAGNPWLWDQVLAGHVAICAATALAPLLLRALVRLYQGETAQGWLLLALAALVLLADSRISLFLYLACFAGAIIGVTRRRWRFATFAVLAPFAGVAANGWWTLTYLFGKSGDPVPWFYPSVEDVVSTSAFADLQHALVLSGYFLHFEWQRALQQGGFVFGVWYVAVAFLIVVPTLLARGRVAVWTLRIALLVALFLSMGSHASPIDAWLYEHFRLMALLREPVKYGFAVTFCAGVLLVLWLLRAGAAARVTATLAVIVAVSPIFTGALDVPDGHGLQVFSERDRFLDMLAFLERRPGAYRIAVLPPWLAEQSLAPGEFFVANPFVFQSEIPVVDAPLINTATPESGAAWQAYYGLYWGTDPHPAATLAALGVRYVIVLDDAALSPGAQYTSFAGVPISQIHYTLSEDPAFRVAYHDGPYWIYEDEKYRALVHDADEPLVVGPRARAGGEAHPARRLGDDVARSKHPPPPRGLASIANGPISACVDTAPYSAIANAYASVGAFQDWTQHWVASDWVIRGGDDLDQRLLARFGLPYAFTRSRESIAVTIQPSAPGTVFLQLGSLDQISTVDVRLDGEAARGFVIGDSGFEWYRLGNVTAGVHTVTIAGNASGVLARAVVVTNACAHPSLPAGARYVLSQPLSVLAIGERQPFAVDGVPERSGAPFSLLRGVHALDTYASSGTALSSGWDLLSSPPFEIEPGTEAQGDRLLIRGGAAPQGAILHVDGVPAGTMTIVRLQASGPAQGARLGVSAGAINFYFNLARLGSQRFLVPYLGPSYDVIFTVPSMVGSVVVREAMVTRAVPMAPTTYFDAPANETAGPLLPAIPLTLRSDGALIDAHGERAPFAGVSGSAYVRLLLRGLRARSPETAVVTAYYERPFEVQGERIVAVVPVDPQARNYALLVPVLPHAVDVIFSIAPAQAGGAPLQLSALLERDAHVSPPSVLVPSMMPHEGQAIAYERPSPELLHLGPQHGPWVVVNETYDPNWTAANSAAHWRVDGYENGWNGLPGQSDLAYSLQPAFSRLQILFLVYLGVAFSLWLLHALLRRRLLR